MEVRAPRRAPVFLLSGAKPPGPGPAPAPSHLLLHTDSAQPQGGTPASNPSGSAGVMVADGGRLPTASSPSGPRAFSSCHLPRCHGTSVLGATVHALSVALPRGALTTTHTWAECWAWGWQGSRSGGKPPTTPAVTTLALWKLLPCLTSSPLAAASTLALHPTSAPHLCLTPGVPDAEISDGGVHLAIGVGDTRLESWRPPGRARSARQDTFLPG